MTDRTRIDWTAPAQLVVWPGEETEERPVTTLREAVQAAGAIAAGVAWIVLADGRILRPGQIAELRAAMTSG
ncbi:hypothetical protein [Methylobacterium platani]|uniref:Uncharacterized protein n=2 Tax=Methylobacterium platani TaxID=427683 RepID=A0A179SIJ7_9HYPH|nr:hypothetical protein [Methylobacterium platani]KMO19066.1 hypothetical protein SQ03_08595 [Methylobacterium platani JCM 14648]OAS27355.1 hypothetical protein A5481_02740 [Methylobacterium platani]